jgi:cellulose 1,4-beta-cellobiosidase
MWSPRKPLVHFLLRIAAAQQAGYVTPEQSPPCPLTQCTGQGACRTELDTTLVLAAEWRWLHITNGYSNCYTDGVWDPTFCPDGVTCARNCALDGVSAFQYQNTYGVEPIPGGDSLQYVTGSNVGSRLYLARPNGYATLRLKNREISFTADVSQLPCGVNFATYLTSMDAHGGLGQGDNNAGWKYGTAYADAQCPKDLKFIRGVANIHKDVGSCGTEIDLLEANSEAMAFTLHSCLHQGPCEGGVATVRVLRAERM